MPFLKKSIIERTDVIYKPTLHKSHRKMDQASTFFGSIFLGMWHEISRLPTETSIRNWHLKWSPGSGRFWQRLITPFVPSSLGVEQDRVEEMELYCMLPPVDG